MSYLVMECHPGYAILLDEEGRFLKAANLRYEIGQTVYNPVLMKKAPEKQWNIVRRISSGIAAIAACFLFVFGISYYQNYIQLYSSIYLTINPEVQMDLNRRGMVVRLTGTNEDGKTLLEGYDGKGKDKVTVADELIDRAIEMDFLSEGGRVSFSIDSPDDALFQEYGMELRTEVTEHLAGRITITIEIINYKDGRGQESLESSSSQSSAACQRPLRRRLLRRSLHRLPCPNRPGLKLHLRNLSGPPTMMIQTMVPITMVLPIICRQPAQHRLSAVRRRPVRSQPVQYRRIRTMAPEMTGIRTICCQPAQHQLSAVRHRPVRSQPV